MTHRDELAETVEDVTFATEAEAGCLRRAATNQLRTCGEQLRTIAEALEAEGRRSTSRRLVQAFTAIEAILGLLN